MTYLGDLVLGAFAGEHPGERPRGVTAEEWQEANREVTRRFRRARLKPLYDTFYGLGYLAYGFALIVAVLALAALIAWLSDLL